MKHSLSNKPRSMKRSLSHALLGSVALLGAIACGSDAAAPANVTPGEPTSVSPTAPNTDTTSPSTTPSPTTTNPSPVTPGDPTPAPVAPDKDKGPELTTCESSAIGAPVFRALTRSEFENSINDIFPGIAGKWSNTLPSNLVSGAGFDNDVKSQIGEQTAEQLLSTAESIGDAVSSSLASLVSCSAAADHACAAEFVDTYGERLFRRPLTEAEQTQYLAFFDTALADTDFAKAMKWLTAALVQSPKSVYRSEIGTVAGTTRNLSQHEVATLLAYAFTGTTPSADLLAKADQGQLTNPVEIAKALLQTDAGKQTLRRFFEAYTGYVRAASKSKPAYVEDETDLKYNDVSQDMVEETRVFLDKLLFEQGATWQDVLTSTTTYPSSKLASFYGTAAPSADYAAVERVTNQGVGLMAQGSFLAAHANADASSPTQRGLFAYVNLLCRSKPILPDNVPPLGDAAAAKTTRERYEIQHAKDGCATCHKLFDPIGFGFEHFDEAGRYRADEKGETIDPTGSLISATGELLEFASQEELATKLAALPEVQQCFASYLGTYAFGTTKSCLATASVAPMQEGSMSIVDAFASLASEPHFTTRSAQ
jgi:hypothetical protein